MAFFKLNFFIATVLLGSTALADACPKAMIDGPEAGKVSLAAPAECQTAQMFTCKSGSPRVVTRIREGKNIHVAYCEKSVIAQVSREEADIEEANARGITLKKLYDEREARHKRDEVKPSTANQQELARTLTQEVPMGAQLSQGMALSGQFARSSAPDVLRKEAEKAGVPKVIFDRAFANYQKETLAGNTKRSCFMAGDMTTPQMAKMWIICATTPPKIIEFPSHVAKGMGPTCRDDAFQNKGDCAKYFSNKMNSCLPVGGNFITSIATVGKGKSRTLIELKGLEEFNKNSNARRIGIHRSITADGKSYATPTQADASQGCFVIPEKLPGFEDTDLASSHSGKGMAFYVYPSPSDIKALSEGKDAYWDATCKKEIGAPAWMGENGDNYYDAKAIEKDQVDYINNYYQEEVPADAELKPEPRSNRPADTTR